MLNPFFCVCATNQNCNTSRQRYSTNSQDPYRYDGIVSNSAFMKLLIWSPALDHGRMGMDALDGPVAELTVAYTVRQ